MDFLDEINIFSEDGRKSDEMNEVDF